MRVMHVVCEVRVRGYYDAYCGSVGSTHVNVDRSSEGNSNDTCIRYVVGEVLNVLLLSSSAWSLSHIIYI